ncbi:MAG: O-antigen ligase family protein [Rhizobiaceae bacterium]|nr:O-antigen ligase family protein [Rhizobiaceae bacterium]
MDRPGRENTSGRQKSIGKKAIFWVAFWGFPLSLTSPGATVAMGLVALYGAKVATMNGKIPGDILQCGLCLLSLYILLLSVDILNGGGIYNLTSTAINYLPLLATAPYAFALRNVEFDMGDLDRSLALALVVAIVISVAQFALFDVYRPGGLNLNSVPFAFVIALWSVALLSRSADGARFNSAYLATAIAAFVPVLLSQSKIAIFCMLLGYTIVGLAMLRTVRITGARAAGMVFLVASIVLTVTYGASTRVLSMWAEIANIWAEGPLARGSFADRFELILASWQAFLVRPWLGHGLAEARAVVDSVGTQTGLVVSDLGHLHNDYATHIVAFGVSGAAFLLGYLAFVIWRGLSAKNDSLRRVGIAWGVMIAAYMTFEVAFNMDPISGATTLALGSLIALGNRRENHSTRVI